MRSSPLIIAILLMASLTFAQDCNNPLLSFYNIPGLDNPESGADLPYCSNLQDGETCCSAETVAGFQDRVNNVIGKLNNYFAAKDLYLQQLKDKYLARFNQYLDSIDENHKDELDQVRAANATLADEIQQDINTWSFASADAQNISDGFKQAIYEYQKIRTDCFTTALQIHTYTWCLACDPNYASQGVSEDGSVTFSDGICEDIEKHCWRFFDRGAKFNPLIKAREEYWKLRALVNYLQDLSGDGEAAPLNASGDPYNPLSTQLAVNVPDKWTGNEGEAGGTQQCANLWIGDELLAELLTIGPPVTTVTQDNEALVSSEEEIVFNGGRRLVVGAILAGVAGLTLGLLADDSGDIFGDTDWSDLGFDLDEIDDDLFDDDIFKVRLP